MYFYMYPIFLRAFSSFPLQLSAVIWCRKQLPKRPSSNPLISSLLCFLRVEVPPSNSQSHKCKQWSISFSGSDNQYWQTGQGEVRDSGDVLVAVEHVVTKEVVEDCMRRLLPKDQKYIHLKSPKTRLSNSKHISNSRIWNTKLYSKLYSQNVFFFIKKPLINSKI